MTNVTTQNLWEAWKGNSRIFKYLTKELLKSVGCDMVHACGMWFDLYTDPIWHWCINNNTVDKTATRH